MTNQTKDSKADVLLLAIISVKLLLHSIDLHKTSTSSLTRIDIQNLAAMPEEVMPYRYEHAAENGGITFLRHIKSTGSAEDWKKHSDIVTTAIRNSIKSTIENSRKPGQPPRQVKEVRITYVHCCCQTYTGNPDLAYRNINYEYGGMARFEFKAGWVDCFDAFNEDQPGTGKVAYFSMRPKTALATAMGRYATASCTLGKQPHSQTEVEHGSDSETQEEESPKSGCIMC